MLYLFPSIGPVLFAFIIYGASWSRTSRPSRRTLSGSSTLNPFNQLGRSPRFRDAPISLFPGLVRIPTSPDAPRGIHLSLSPPLLLHLSPPLRVSMGATPCFEPPLPSPLSLGFGYGPHPYPFAVVGGGLGEVDERGRADVHVQPSSRLEPNPWHVPVAPRLPWPSTSWCSWATRAWARPASSPGSCTTSSTTPTRCAVGTRPKPRRYAGRETNAWAWIQGEKGRKWKVEARPGGPAGVDGDGSNRPTCTRARKRDASLKRW